MAAVEEMVRQQLDQIISRTELRAEQQSIHANALAPYGAEAKKAQSELALMLTGLAKLKAMSNEFFQPQPRSVYRHPVFVTSKQKSRIMM
jgi:hypothetical protein